MDINDGLDHLSKLLEESGAEGDMSEIPVPLDEFLYSKDYLRCPPLSPIQYGFVEALSDIYKGCSYTEVVAEWGKGGGKDFVCACSLSRVVYLLWCLKDPAAYYGLKSGSQIDAINIAVNAEQANEVFFVQFANLIDGAPIFKRIGYHAKSGHINFPKNISTISGHSEMEGLEGHNVIVAILDEIDAFKTEQELGGNRFRKVKSAKFIYDRMRTSSQSRFPGIGKIASISFPRFAGSFIQQRRIAGLKEEHTYVSDPEGVPTWVANPLRTRADFDDEFKRDPEMAAMMYECKPPLARDVYFRYPNFILTAFGAKLEEYNVLFDEDNAHPVMEFVGYEPPMMVPKEDLVYFIHIDSAKNRDRCGFAMVTYDGNKLKIPLVAGFKAPINGEIDFESVRNIVKKLASMGFLIRKVTYDGYQSVESIQQLNKEGFDAATLSVKKPQYDSLKDILYASNASGCFDALLVEELLTVELLGGKVIDHKVGGSNDIADAVAGATFSALQNLGCLPDIKLIGFDKEEEETESEADFDKRVIEAIRHGNRTVILGFGEGGDLDDEDYLC